jgi:hydrophobe/amphiphile efflux-1 (HAE1) family protein
MLLSIADTFIRRPVLTTVCTLLILLIGAVCIPLLPLDKLPEMALKQITVTANYLGADAKTAEENVTTVLERQINGTEQVLYMSSQTTNNGDTTINVSFPTEMDRNTAQVLVQNNVAVAEAELPEEVNRTGVTTQKQSPSITIAYSFYSDKNENGKYIYDPVFISNYVDRQITNEIKAIQGVGSVRLVGERKYAMRIWLDPDALAARNITTSDVINAISEQNIQVGAGRIGQQPTPTEQQYELPIRAVGRFTTPAEAEDIVVKVGEGGSLIKVKDVGRAEVGAQEYNSSNMVNAQPSISLLAYQLPGSNAWDTANAIKAKISELEQTFPPGLKTTVVLDNTLFVGASLEEAFKTLTEAIALVFLVIFIFLQDWRTTIIPAIAIPVSLIGAMACAYAFGFTLNQLTLFGVILATGLVVDDGIVVVEAIAAKLADGMRPIQAALDAMNELTSAVIATSVVLMAVFIPVTFFPGTTGIVYKQFALIIVFSIAISTFNALTFSPSMSAIIMRPARELHGPLAVFFRWFNRAFDWFKGIYVKIVEFTIRIRLLVIAIFIAGLVATGWIYQTTPQGFIPEEDQGYLFAIVEAPAGVSLNYSTDLVKRISEEVIMPIPDVEYTVGNPGFGFEGNASNKTLFFVKLKPWEERPGEDKSVFGIIKKINQGLQEKIPEARAIAINAPPVDGLGATGGFEFFVQNRQALPMEALIDNTQKVIAAAQKRPELAGVFTQFTFNSPMMQVSIDRNQAKAQNIQVSDIFYKV